ncbi:ABC transporter permease [Paenibacillus senegalensis]|uniref:ABC transporter permease n=1 Tax=Paenibacillus senegalensis TaxID=1465766 RepID=UPI00028948D4|nr:ABC transporter permease [Paenibacillus senegalensis]
MANLIYCELLKLKRSKMLLISFLGALVTPLMMIADGMKVHFSEPDIEITLSGLYFSCSLYTMVLFGPVVYSVIAAHLFSREHSEQTLKTVLTVPVSKLSFMASKFIMLLIWIMGLTLVTWAAMFILGAAFGAVFGIAEFSFMVAIRYLGEMIPGGLLMFLTVSPFAYLAVRSKGLVLPIIAAATVVMGNVGLSNEALGALYPWTAIYLVVSGGIAQTGYPVSIAVALIALVSILGFLLSFVHFHREDIK